MVILDHLALLGDFPFLVGNLLARRGNLHIDLAELQLHALIDGIGGDTAGGDRALIPAAHRVELALLSLLEILELTAGGDHVRGLVREAQQQLIEVRLSFADEGGRIGSAVRTARR